MKKIIAIISIVVAIVSTISTVIAYKNGAKLKISETPYSAQYDRRNKNYVTTVKIRTAVPTDPPVICKLDGDYYYFYPVYHYGDDEMDRGFIILVTKPTETFSENWYTVFQNMRSDLLAAEDIEEVLGYDIVGSFVMANEFFDKDSLETVNSLFTECIQRDCYKFDSEKYIDYSESDIYTPGAMYVLMDSDGLLGKYNSNRTLVFILITISLVSSIVFAITFILLVIEDRRCRR